MCQYTGVVNIFMEICMGVRFDSDLSLQALCDEGVRQGYLNADNPLRASVVADPIFERKNTRDNTPCMLQISLVPGHQIHLHVSAKGGGSENKAHFAMLNPSDSLVDWVLETVPQMGAGWCPPGILGIGVGGSADKSMLLAKESLSEPLDMLDLLAKGPQSKLDEDRKSTRLNSSHVAISYAVICMKKKYHKNEIEHL